MRLCLFGGGRLMGDVPVLYKSTFIALAFGLVFG